MSRTGSPVDQFASDRAELNLLRPWREPVPRSRILSASLGSIAVHLAIVAALFELPGDSLVRQTPARTDLSKSVRLLLPRDLEVTQKEPNQGKVTRALDVRSMVQAPRPQAPRFLPPAPRPEPIRQPPAQVPSIEPPKIEIAASAPPPVSGANPIPTPPPPPEKPKLAFENVGGGTSKGTTPNQNPKVQPPKTSVEDAVRSAQSSQGSGGLIVGDIGDDLASLPGLNQPPTPGALGSNLQLLSDPRGADFKPYLIQVLAAVRRNWLAIIPESARMGRRGRVLIQFIIDRRGGVPKLVIATPSGTEAFDRAAVAGISASYPFPPLPLDYKGDQIRLQLSFAYNVPAQ
jgi:TonB family protein